MKQLKSLILCAAAFTAPLAAQNSAFDDLVADGDNFSNWIGTFTFTTAFDGTEGFINHAEHGALFLWTQGQDVWLYDWNIAAVEGLTGWIYTSREVFPFFFVEGLPDQWVVFVAGVPGPEATSRIFISAANGTPILLPKHSTRNLAEVAIAAGDFSTLVTALTVTNLATTVATGGPFTVFAPTDAAFAKLDAEVLNALVTEQTDTLANILLYHVVDGIFTSDMLLFDPMSVFRGQQLDFFVPTLAGSELSLQVTPFGLLINGSSVVQAADIRAANGVIHVIDTVLTPPGTIVDLAISNGFSTLVDLVLAADLAGLLSSEGPFTVFAPTNDAFAALDPATVAFLLSEEGRETLISILTYHVIPGKIFASEVPVGVEVPTANGAPVVFSSTASGLAINGANIVATNVLGSNGIVHVIDAVILPPAEEMVTTFTIGFDAAAFNYTINGEVAPTLTLRRGVTYTFERGAFTGHPFTLGTVAPGTAWNETQRYNNVANLTAAGETIVYTPGANTPDTLFYRCTVHTPMGGQINVVD